MCPTCYSAPTIRQDGGEPGHGDESLAHLRTGIWATGVHRTLAEAFEAMYRLNRQEAALAGDLAPLTE